MKRKRVAYLAAVVAVWFVGTMRADVAQVPKYTVIDLGTLGGNWSEAHGINDYGQVVGYSKTQSERKHAFLYSNGTMKDLGTLEGDSNSYARGINNKGEVVGYSETRVGDGRAFFYSNGIIQDLSTLVGWNSYGYGINNHSQAVGGFLTQSREHRTFLYSSVGAVKDLGTFGGTWSEARGINDNGQVVGDFSTALGDKNIFLYSPDGSVKDLGILGRITSAARGINNKGEVVGWSVIRGKLGILSSRAFLYSNGVMQDIGTLEGRDSYAYGINNHGQVVGAIEWFGDWGREGLAFLYSNGITMDLNDLIDKGSGWQLYEATAINDRGQIVGRGRNPSDKGRAFLLNPIAPDWRNVIENQPVQPTYTEPPKKDVAKDSLVVVTHGWQPAFLPVDIKWVDTMTNAISRYLINQGLANWQVHAHRWVEKARTGTVKGAMNNAKPEGESLGRYIISQSFTKVHLIGHSAAAELLQDACEKVKGLNSNVLVHLTFLDPFVGFDYAGVRNYGKGADWAENYFSRDALTSPIDHRYTEGPLDNVYNVDVTFLDTKNRVVTDTYRSADNGTLKQCTETRTSHGWPYEFYSATIPPSTMGNSRGFGFLLSEESGGLAGAISRYGKRGNDPETLGTPDPQCPTANLYITTPSFLGPKLEFKETSVIKSPTGTIKLDNFGVTLITGSPVWVVSNHVITNKVNLISFEYRFLSGNGSEGLVTVYSGTNVLGVIDERVAPSGTHTNRFTLPETITQSTAMLGFRLDMFSGIASSVTITNVSLGFAGLNQPFSLSATGAYENNKPVFELTGPAGYNYSVETSTNITDWTSIALLLNTSGTVRFVDSSSDNTTTRFYRAVGP